MLPEIEARPDIDKSKENHGNCHDFFSYKEEEEGGQSHIVRRMGGEKAIVLLAISTGYMEHEAQLFHITRSYSAYKRLYDEIADSCRQCETHAYGTDTYQSLTTVGMVVKNQI